MASPVAAFNIDHETWHFAVVVCDDGSVWKARVAGPGGDENLTWHEVTAVPGTPRATGSTRLKGE